VFYLDKTCLPQSHEVVVNIENGVGLFVFNGAIPGGIDCQYGIELEKGKWFI
jgi:hypothetical protein